MNKGKRKLFKEAILVGVACGALFFSLLSGMAQEAYPAIDTKTSLFDVEQIPAASRSEIVSFTTIIASNFPEVSPKTRAMCLAIALRLDPLYKPAFLANFALESGNAPAPIGEMKMDEAISGLVKATESVIQPTSGPESKKLAAHLLDILTAIAPTNPEVVYASKVFQSVDANPKAQWDVVFSEVEPSDTGAPSGTSPDSMSQTGQGSSALLSKTEATIKTLIFQEPSYNKYVTKATEMNISARKYASTREMRVDYGQSVGSVARNALLEVIKHLRTRHKGLPSGYIVEINFEDRYLKKDGPATTLPSGLLLESMLSGFSWDPGCFFVGDVNADGTIQPVAGMDSKIRGAHANGGGAIGIPAKNSQAVSDMLIFDGPETLAGIQIFSLSTFDEAIALAKSHDTRDKKLRLAIDKFSEVQAVLGREDGMKFLRNPHVITKLQEVVQLAPNHLSAQGLILSGQGREPAQLSLEGSLTGIDLTAGDLIDAVNNHFNAESSSLTDEEFAMISQKMTRIRTKLDPRAKACADAIVDFIGLTRNFMRDPPTVYANREKATDAIEAAAKEVKTEYNRLDTNRDIVEELRN